MKIHKRHSDLQFCSITTLTPEERKFIWNHLTFEGGGMRTLLKDRRSKCPLVLMRYKKTLVGWACLFHGEPSSKFCSKNPKIMAFVDLDYRNSGIATLLIQNLLQRHSGKVKNIQIDTYHESTESIAKKFHPKVVEQRFEFGDFGEKYNASPRIFGDYNHRYP